MDVSSLTLEQCPLLPPDARSLVDDFNRVAALRRELAGRYPAIRADLDKQAEGMLDLRERLTRAQYRVGFLGTTQVGKSTTFNHILRVSEEDAPALSGKGDATTSAVSRLRRSADGRCSLLLRYLTQDQYKAKRHALCDAIGPPVGHGMEDREILALLPALRAEVHAGRREGNVTDVDALRLLLESHAAYGRYVQMQAHVEHEDYSHRRDVLNHAIAKGEQPRPTAHLLLREVELTSLTEAIPPCLEMIDLPGLGSQGVIDSHLTLDFLRELDGALIFLRADQIGDQNIEQILSKLKPIFEGRWSRRIWVIATRFDALTGTHFTGERTWFDIIASFLDRHHIPVQNLTIVSNEVHKLVTKAVSPEERELRAGIKLGRPVNDPVFARYPAFQSLIAEVYRDGGIARLRELLTSHLADAVGAEIREAAAEKIRETERQLHRSENREQLRQSQSQQALLQAQKCRRTVNELLDELAARSPLVEEPGRKLVAVLQTTLLDSLPVAPERLYERPIEQLREDFPTTVAYLDRQFRDLLDTTVIDPMYDYVEQKLKGLPAVAVADAETAHEAWQNYTDDDRKDQAWRNRFPRFGDDRLFPQLTATDSDRRGFHGNDYRDVMEEKIRQVAGQAVHAVRVRLKYRLRLIEQDLAALIR